MLAVVDLEVKSSSQSLKGGLEYGVCLFYSCIVTLGHERMSVDLSHQIPSNYLCDNVYKSYMTLSYCSCSFYREK